MSISLRAAEPADVPLLLELIRYLARYEHLEHEVEGTPERLHAHLFGERPAAGAIIAEWAGEPVGFALYFTNYSTFLTRPGIYLEDLFVRPEHRGRGVGRALLLHLAKEAHARGCGRMEWSVLDWNEPAIRFYESLGARRLNDWTICRLDRAALARIAAGEAQPSTP